MPSIHTELPTARGEKPGERDAPPPPSSRPHAPVAWRLGGGKADKTWGEGVAVAANRVSLGLPGRGDPGPSVSIPWRVNQNLLDACKKIISGGAWFVVSFSACKSLFLEMNYILLFLSFLENGYIIMCFQ